MFSYKAQKNAVIQHNLLSEDTVIAICGNGESYNNNQCAEIIAELVNLNSDSIMRGFRGGVTEEIEVMSKTFGDLISLMRKYSDTEMSRELFAILTKIRERGFILRSE